MGKEFGHYRPIQDSYADFLGLQYDLSSYYVCSRQTYLSRIMEHEAAVDSVYVADMDALKLILVDTVS